MIKHWQAGLVAASVAMAASITPAAADYRTCMEFCTKEHTFTRCNEMCAGQAGGAPEAGADCSTDELKQEAVFDFIEEHYRNGFMMAFPSDDGPKLFEVYFNYYLPSEQELACEGRVKVDDYCRITDVDGNPLNRAASREQALQCALSSG